MPATIEHKPVETEEAEQQPMTAGEYLRSVREKNGLTLRDIQKESGFNSGYLSQIEHGAVKGVNVLTVPRLAEAYGIDAIDLLKAYGIEIPEEVELNQADQRAIKLGRQILELSPQAIKDIEQILDFLNPKQ